MKYLLLPFIVLWLILGCQKEKMPDPPPPPPDTTAVYVPIYKPGDTSLGAGYAKKLTANWKAEGICVVQSFFDTNYMALIFLTYSNAGALRESFGFSFIPRFEGAKTYGLKKMKGSTLVPGFVSHTYTTWTSDEDVTDDEYDLDTTANDNFLRMQTIDHVNKRVEGTFTATFKIKEPRNNPINPYKVKFSEGKFWAVIQD
jgi:hypothetical protein